MKWRKWNTILHRDLGYLCFGLTLVYALSGVAVNHIADWNPNYRIEQSLSRVDLSLLGEAGSAQMITALLKELGETGQVKDSFRPDRETLKIFVDGNTLTVRLSSGEVSQEKIAKRKGLFQMNFLHLNHPKKMWTWFADLYAVALAFLAISGLLILPGKKGIRGRGAWLSLAGIALPLFFVWFYS